MGGRRHLRRWTDAGEGADGRERGLMMVMIRRVPPLSLWTQGSWRQNGPGGDTGGSKADTTDGGLREEITGRVPRRLSIRSFER